MKTTNANLEIKILCNCPECKAEIDIAEQTFASGEALEDILDCENFLVECPECKNYFLIQNIDYC
jgi:hypothetical protein